MADFTCCECRRDITSIGIGCEKVPDPPLCVTCLMVPGWTRIPELILMFDPHNRRARETEGG